MTEILKNVLERVSIPANFLEEPAPEGEDWQLIIKAGLAAPDHACLRPWRFLEIRGQAREKLGELFCDAMRLDNPEVSDDELSATREKPLRAPLILAVVAAIKPHPKVPDHEQIASTAAATQNMQLAANALGYGSIWLTGPFASHSHVCSQLGLDEAEKIVAFLYFGTPSAAAAITKKKLQRRPQAADYLVEWGKE